MGLTLTELEDEVYDNTGTEETDPDLERPIVRQYLNRSYWEVDNKLNFRQQDNIYTFVMTPSVNSYPITNYVNDFAAIRHVTILDPVNDPSYWQEVIQTDYSNLLDEEDTQNPSQAVPTRYARYGNNIVFNVLPASAYQVKVLYKKKLGNIASGGPDIPEEWHEAILYGAIGRVWMRLSYTTRANQAFAYQTQLISTMLEAQSREDRDYSRSAGQIIRRKYP